MWKVVRSLVDEGATVLLTTQYLEEADELADEITVIDRGRVIANDTPQGLKQIVGGQTLTVRPADSHKHQDALAIVSEVAQVRPDVDRGGLISVPVAGDHVLTEAVARLAAHDIAVAELSLHLPSLDEAFLALTGAATSKPTLELVEAAA
jgi:oleandomycin transport system ATP-binding protein